MTGALVKLGKGVTAALLGGDRFGWAPYLLLWMGLALGAAFGALAFTSLGAGALWIAAGLMAALCALSVGLRLEEPSRECIAWSEMFTPVRSGVPVEKMLDLATAARAIATFLAPSRLSRVEQVFDAASFTAAQAAALGVKRSEPAMRVQRRYRDGNGRLLMLAISLHPPGRFAYSMVLSRNGAR